MPPPPKKKNSGGPLPPKRSDEVEFQANPIFSDKTEMEEWVKKNIPGAVIIRSWVVERLACVVRVAAVPKGSLITIKKRKKR